MDRNANNIYILFKNICFYFTFENIIQNEIEYNKKE